MLAQRGFTVESTLGGKANELKETVIGVEVFDKDASYSPREDPIVRVMAGRLRGKLAEYYQREGAADLVLIELPRGSYVPRFTFRDDASGASSACDAFKKIARLTDVFSCFVPVQPTPVRRPTVLLLVAALILSAVAGGSLALVRHGIRDPKPCLVANPSGDRGGPCRMATSPDKLVVTLAAAHQGRTMHAGPPVVRNIGASTTTPSSKQIIVMDSFPRCDL